MASKARELLLINIKIEEKEDLRRRAVWRKVWPIRILAIFAAYAIPVIVTTVFTFDRFDMSPFIIILVGISIILIALVVIYASAAIVDELPSIKSIESELGALKQDRRILEGSLKLTVLEAKASYLEEAERDVNRLNKGGSKNRIYHNVLQSIIIVGSLTATTLSGLSLGAIDAALPAAAISLIVGISAGFAGYFKFRERSYYLNSTADAIEHEVVEFEQGIGRYRNREPEEALKEFISETHRLRKEQKKQQQDLDRPINEYSSSDS
ncbi:DUF4231 domain-containing protein [Rhodococcus opacus]|uniref:DUF4231 domain-containing protein n=1 Tax=Rhodococcus opacus TaxID=37919 RepID=UPI001FF2F502|nr:DUF4231 domain-containing protein [Rhodococcus opacus]UOT04481.1 DUF4231 domain-containing protein [Rhodococcus opacus]